MDKELFRLIYSQNINKLNINALKMFSFENQKKLINIILISCTIQIFILLLKSILKSNAQIFCK